MANFKLLGDRLEWAKAFREERTGLTSSWADMARICKATPAAVSRWKNNLNGIDGEFARPLANWLGVDAVWLETGEGSPTQNAEIHVDHIKPKSLELKGAENSVSISANDHKLYAEIGELTLLYLQADATEREVILTTARSTQPQTTSSLDDATNKG